MTAAILCIQRTADGLSLFLKFKFLLTGSKWKALVIEGFFLENEAYLDCEFSWACDLPYFWISWSYISLLSKLHPTPITLVGLCILFWWFNGWVFMKA